MKSAPIRSTIVLASPPTFAAGSCFHVEMHPINPFNGIYI